MVDNVKHDVDSSVFIASKKVTEGSNQTPELLPVPTHPTSSEPPTPIPPNYNDPSAISLLAKDCLQRFQIICKILQNSEPSKDGQNGFDQDLALLTMQDARARFKAWGGSIAAFHDGQIRTSLDFRLREASGIRGRALRILEELQEYLHEATLIVTGEKPNEQWDVSVSSDDSEQEDATTSDEKENKREKEKRGEEEQQQEPSELQELFSAIGSSNASLMKISMVIRNSPARDDYLKAASRFKDWNPYPDIDYVREKHGSAKGSTDWLLNRLGKGITRRRQFLRYRVEHFEKLSGGWGEGEKAEKDDEKPKKTIASTKATTFMGNDNIYQREGSDTAGSFGSQTSYEATVLGDENDSHKLTVPPPPKLAFPDIPFKLGEPFNCPYCYIEQNVRNKAAWKKHVFRDLKPYVCTFKGCDMMMFRSRNEWFAHELQNHRRQWACQYCQHDAFATSGAFSKHITSSHAAVLASSQMEAVMLQSEEAVETISAFACPLCDEWETNIKARQGKQDPRTRILADREILEPHGTRNQFRRHLGRHMEQLALFALPLREIDELDNDSTDEDEEDASNHIFVASGELSQPVVRGKEPASMSGSSSLEIQAEEESRDVLPSAKGAEIAAGLERRPEREADESIAIVQSFHQQLPLDANIEYATRPISSSLDDQPEEEEKQGSMHQPSSSSRPPGTKKGAFHNDLDFTTTIAAGLQNIGFDPNIVINDPKYRRRASPPGVLLTEADLRNLSVVDPFAAAYEAGRIDANADRFGVESTSPSSFAQPAHSISSPQDRTTSPTNTEFEVEQSRKELEAYKLETEREQEKKLANKEAEEAIEKWKKQEAEKIAKEKVEKEEREKGYARRLEEDMRRSGMDERQIDAVTKKQTAMDPKLPIYTRMARRHLSIETLNRFRIDYELDTDPDYVLIKRWVPEYEQDLLWSHTREIRETRGPSPLGIVQEGREIEHVIVRKKKTRKSVLSPLLTFFAGDRRDEGEGSGKAT